MQFMPRLFIGGHRELRRPENIVDESLMARIEEARRRLSLEGKDVKPVLTAPEPERRSEHDAHRRAFAQRVVRSSADTSISARNTAS